MKSHAMREPVKFEVVFAAEILHVNMVLVRVRVLVPCVTSNDKDAVFFELVAYPGVSVFLQLVQRFINSLLNKKGDIMRVYLPPDAGGQCDRPPHFAKGKR
jgi:hypothetical protein